MVLVVLDGTSLMRFVNDKEAFVAAMALQFRQADVDADGMLSPQEFRQALQELPLQPPNEKGALDVPAGSSDVVDGKIYDWLFHVFDADGAGAVSLPQFVEQMRRLLVVMAEGMGPTPLHVLLLDNQCSLLTKVIAHCQ